MNFKLKAFKQIFLKLKFENIHSSNPAQQIEPDDIFKEAIRQNLKQEDWRDFILEELKHPNTYIEKARLDKEIKKRKMAGLK